MTSLRYQSGSHLLVVHDGRACLVAGDADSALCTALWETMCGHPAEPVDDLLDTLVSTYGLRSLPSFALLAADPQGDVVAVVRGDLTVRSGGVEQPLVASGAAPWTTHVVSAAELAVGTVDENAPTLPLRSGVVRAAGLLWGDHEAHPSSPLAEPGPAPQAPVPAPEPEHPPEPDRANEVEDEEASGYTELFQRRRPVPPPVEATRAPAAPATPAAEAAALTEAEATTEPDPVFEPDLQQTGSTQVWTGESARTHPAPSAPPSTRGGLIDGIPGFSASSPSSAPPPPTALPHPPPVVAPTSRQAPAAATTPPAPAPAPAEPDEQLSATTPRAAGQMGRSVPDVLAARCPAGHWSPAHAPTCRVCDLGIPSQQPVWMTRPRLGRLLLPRGETLDVDRGAVFGRAPHAPSDSPERPHLVNISSYGPHLSRMHVEIVLDGWFALVRDLGSTEGTTLTIPGLPPERLRAGELVTLANGSTVDLAGDYVFTFEAGS